jgi:hypothetical protein
VITEINLSLGITKPNAIGFTAKFYQLYRQILFILYAQSLFVIMSFCL